MSVCAIVPVRDRCRGKTRLAGTLDPHGREQLLRGMLGRVLDALRGSGAIDEIVLVTSDATLPGAGVTVLQDSGSGLNAAIRAGLVHAARAHDRAIVVAADTPHVTAAEIERLVAATRIVDVVVVPDHAGQGTNALGLRLPARIEPAFGERSCAAHVRAATIAGAQLEVLPLAGLARDIDVPADLDTYVPPSREQALALAARDDTDTLMLQAETLARRGFGARVSYSRKVFIPLTQLCRDVCHYCTFAGPPRAGRAPYLTQTQVLELARAGARAGCQEALFTLGDRPEARFAAARGQLDELGFATTLEYLEHCARLVFEETGLLPHLNAGHMTRVDFERLRRVSASMGAMLESSAERLAQKGGPHHRSPDKQPAARLATLRAAGEAAVPYTTGILVGIGETRRERIESLLTIRDLHERYGHVQEIIVQNFRAKPGTRMARHPEPAVEELLWTIAVTRLLFGPSMSIQAPPNLSPGRLHDLIAAGINDWGGVSPVTPDHVNPEAPWPELVALEATTAAAGRALVERLAIAPAFALDRERWLDTALRTPVVRRIDADGYRRDPRWSAGAGDAPPEPHAALVRSRGAAIRGGGRMEEVLRRAGRGERLRERDIVALFASDGSELAAVVRAADELRAATVGADVTYVVNRNINYTNVCSYSCGFCAFAKGRGARSLRGPGYTLDLEEIERRVVEAAGRGATEVCLQGGIHPKFTGETYLEIVAAARRVAPGVHVHAFSPLEIVHGARTLGLTLESYLGRLRDAGLRTLPGTAAEILCDDVRAVICPDKLSTAEWLDVMRTAHRVGLRSTATIMFGHVERPVHWARHLLAVRDLQARTQGFTEFVPLPFVHMEAPLWRRGLARSGPSFREAILMHAVARLVLHPLMQNVQASWVKLGRDGALLALQAGANDFGGVLMNESITRAAGGVNGQAMEAATLEAAIRSIGRAPRQRTTLYGMVDLAVAPTRRHDREPSPVAAAAG
ncbi:MAG TPA: 5-amino-6-(D-ribitylamino)uracil--L-tyrosine 4-hydroxyphenyl transferase CofH [Steroidobacteraceae bacterium]|nr:5-amino-6-(D-ribitylamino)uracil--L-tyrosine 4-hydroxyphenyl transferase CofH [Steroidobacteraceae bacterium]